MTSHGRAFKIALALIFADHPWMWIHMQNYLHLRYSYDSIRGLIHMRYIDKHPSRILYIYWFWNIERNNVAISCQPLLLTSLDLNNSY